MKARIAAIPLLLAVACFLGHAQALAPSISIGTHVLTLGMPESTVLQQLGTDFTLRSFPQGVKASYSKETPESTFGVQKKTESGFVQLGVVSFDANKLVSAHRNWEIEITSSKSFFYAVDLASKSLEREGLTACQLSTIDNGYTRENGSVAFKEIDLDCGMKGESISLSLSDAPDMVPASLSVIEWLRPR